jgi:hypothetical protein
VRALSQLPPAIANLRLETDFLPSLQLDHAAVVDYQLDDPEPYPAERIPQGAEDDRGKIELVAPGVGPGIVVAKRRTQSHCSIYPIGLVE